MQQQMAAAKAMQLQQAQMAQYNAMKAGMMQQQQGAPGMTQGQPNMAALLQAKAGGAAGAAPGGAVRPPAMSPPPMMGAGAAPGLNQQTIQGSLSGKSKGPPPGGPGAPPGPPGAAKPPPPTAPSMDAMMGVAKSKGAAAARVAPPSQPETAGSEGRSVLNYKDLRAMQDAKAKGGGAPAQNWGGNQQNWGGGGNNQAWQRPPADQQNAMAATTGKAKAPQAAPATVGKSSGGAPNMTPPPGNPPGLGTVGKSGGAAPPEKKWDDNNSGWKGNSWNDSSWKDQDWGGKKW